MWKRAHSSGDLSAEVQRSQEQNHNSITDAVRSIFNTTRCYDLMQASCKVIVFESSIPFQLAFYALAEQDANTAPIWDPVQQRFVGMMTSMDFLQALWTYSLSSTRSPDELKYKSIKQMLEETGTGQVFKHDHWQAIDAEKSAYQMCRLLQRQNTDYVPVTDPDEGNLVAVLGYLDMVNLLDTAARQFPHLFSATIDEAKIGTYRVVTCPENMSLGEALRICQQKQISSIPVVNADGVVTGLYYKNDVSFITKSSNPDEILGNVGEVTVADAVRAGASADLADVNANMPPPAIGPDGESVARPALLNTFRTCQPQDPIRHVLATMMEARVTRVVIVDAGMRCMGIVSIKDVIMFYLNS